MGRLIDGQWSNHDLGPDEKGRYVRRATQFRRWVTSDGASAFPAAARRYHLYISHACGWSHRTMLFRALKGLSEVVTVSVTEPFMGSEGWTFASGTDPINDAGKLYEIYLRAKEDYTGRVSVPVLWDSETRTIVSNESSDIIAMFDSAFDGVGGRGDLTLFSEAHAEEIKAHISANYQAVNNGVYRAGFAGSQQAYEEAVVALFERLDELEALLSTRRYLCGDTLTAADLCLFPTLYRFDPVYYVHFKCNLRRLRDYPNLWGYTRDIYQTPGVAETCHLEQIKTHYYTSHESISPRRLVPLGPIIDYDEPHGREALSRA